MTSESPMKRNRKGLARLSHKVRIVAFFLEKKYILYSGVEGKRTGKNNGWNKGRVKKERQQ